MSKAKASKPSKKAAPKKTTRNVVGGVLPPSEKRWRAESDASVLAEAAAIRQDPKRMTAAQKAAQRLAPEKERRAKDAQAEAIAIKALARKTK